jgi:hypothetical protein
MPQALVQEALIIDRPPFRPLSVRHVSEDNSDACEGHVARETPIPLRIYTISLPCKLTESGKMKGKQGICDRSERRETA